VNGRTHVLGDDSVIVAPDRFTSESVRAARVPCDNVTRLMDVRFDVNVQGDEPLVEPADIRRCIAEKAKTPDRILNGFCPLSEAEDPHSVNIPKVVMTESGGMIYMSRRALPGFKEAKNAPARYHKQVCIYGFSRDELEAYVAFGRKSATEQCEDIEILRFMELGRPVQMFETQPGSLAVDVEEDIPPVEAALRRRHAL